MLYELTVTKIEANEHYDEQMKTYREVSRYGGWQGNMPEPERQIRQLTVRLTEAEFEAIKQGIIVEWK
jgi:hypothetical protein